MDTQQQLQLAVAAVVGLAGVAVYFTVYFFEKHKAARARERRQMLGLPADAAEEQCVAVERRLALGL
jgi:hypothetical protein